MTAARVQAIGGKITLFATLPAAGVDLQIPKGSCPLKNQRPLARTKLICCHGGIEADWLPGCPVPLSVGSMSMAAMMFHSGAAEVASPPGFGPLMGNQ